MRVMLLALALLGCGSDPVAVDQPCPGPAAPLYPCTGADGKQQYRDGKPCSICETGAETIPVAGCAMPDQTFCATGSLTSFPQSCALCE